MVDVNIKKSTLSSREEAVLRVFRDSNGAVSTETLKRETGLDHGRIYRTLDKLKRKGYLQLTTRKRLAFYRPKKDIEEVIS